MSAAIRKSKGLGDSSEKFFVEGENTSDDQTAPPPAKKGCNMTPFLLMIALAFHAIFEGIALGLGSDFTKVAQLGLAICLHKWAESLSLGISLSKNFKGMPGYIAGLLFLFAMASPIGIGFGIILGEMDKVVEITFASIAGGTFIYVACSEVIIEEFTVPVYKWIKLLMFLLGGAMIMVMGMLGGPH